MADHTSDASGPPDVPQDSVGSSVSSRFQDEYEELLKYAVVVPKVDFAGLPNVLADPSGSFRGRPLHARFKDASSDDSGESPSTEEVPRRAPASKPQQQQQQRAAAASAAAAVQDLPRSTGRSAAARRLYEPPEVSTDGTLEDSGGRAAGRLPRPMMHLSSPRTNAAHSPLPPQSPDDDRRPLQQRDGGFGALRSPILFSAGAGTDGGPDDDIRTMESKLDLWCRDLKTNIVEEVARMKIKLMEQNRHAVEQLTYQHAQEMQAKQNDLEGMKELLHTYEVSIERKDAVITNLTRSLENQKEKFDVLRNFTEWKLQFYGHKQEGYATRLAQKQCRLSLLRKAWRSWHLIIEEKWRQRVEKACQAKAQEVCVALTNDYETKLASTNEALEEARQEVARLHKEREAYEENMKKAFMRGVCALNLEAMNIFHEPSDAKDSQPPQQRSNDGVQDENVDPLGDACRPLVIQQEPVYASSSSAPMASAGRHAPMGGSDQRQQQHVPAHGRSGASSTSADLHQRARPLAAAGKRPPGTKHFNAKLVAQADQHAAGGGRMKPEGLTGLGHVVVQCHREASDQQQPQESSAAPSASLPKHKPVQLPAMKTVKIVK